MLKIPKSNCCGCAVTMFTQGTWREDKNCFMNAKTFYRCPLCFKWLEEKKDFEWVSVLEGK